MRSVTQDWVLGLSLMQQTVLLTAIRGPDSIPKYGPPKMLLRWYRRCVLLSAMDGKVLDDPISNNGGSFTGPSLHTPTIEENISNSFSGDLDPWCDRMMEHVFAYVQRLDAIPHHFQMHFMHAVEIVGYKHPDVLIRGWWYCVYRRLVDDMHLFPETEEQLDKRLGDTREGWLARSDPATVA